MEPFTTAKISLLGLRSHMRSNLMVAVGTALTGGPPHRSQRAELPHWAPASGSGGEARLREGMHHTDLG
jgi:hypothetical protein